MKKIVVMSDNHMDNEKLYIIKELEPDADIYVHCGDSEASTTLELQGFICVAGNNDWGLKLPKYAQFEADNVKFLITHGQYYGYFDREQKMKKDLKKYDCQVMLSGHTHMPSFTTDEQYSFINPGSTSYPRGGSHPSYAVVYADNGNIEVEFKDI